MTIAASTIAMRTGSNGAPPPTAIVSANSPNTMTPASRIGVDA